MEAARADRYDSRFRIDCTGVAFRTDTPEKLVPPGSSSRVYICPSQWKVTRKHYGRTYAKLAEFGDYEVWVATLGSASSVDFENAASECSVEKEHCAGGGVAISPAGFACLMRTLRSQQTSLQYPSFIATLRWPNVQAQRAVDFVERLEGVLARALPCMPQYAEVVVGITDESCTMVAADVIGLSTQGRVSQLTQPCTDWCHFWPQEKSLGLGISLSTPDFNVKIYNPMAEREVERNIHRVAKQMRCWKQFSLHEQGFTGLHGFMDGIDEAIDEFLREADGKCELDPSTNFPLRTEVCLRVSLFSPAGHPAVCDSLHQGLQAAKNVRRMLHIRERKAADVLKDMHSEIRPWVCLLRQLLREAAHHRKPVPVKRWMVCLAEDIIASWYDGSFANGDEICHPYVEFALHANLLRKGTSVLSGARRIQYVSRHLQLSRSGTELVFDSERLAECAALWYGVGPSLSFMSKELHSAAFRLVGPACSNQEWESLVTVEERRACVLRVVTADLLLFSFPSRSVLETIPREIKEAVILSNHHLAPMFAGDQRSAVEVLAFVRALAAKGFRFSEATKPLKAQESSCQVCWAACKQFLCQPATEETDVKVHKEPEAPVLQGNFERMLYDIPEAEDFLEDVASSIAWLPLLPTLHRSLQPHLDTLVYWVLSDARPSSPPLQNVPTPTTRMKDRGQNDGAKRRRMWQNAPRSELGIRRGIVDRVESSDPPTEPPVKNMAAELAREPSGRARGVSPRSLQNAASARGRRSSVKYNRSTVVKHCIDCGTLIERKDVKPSYWRLHRCNEHGRGWYRAYDKRRKRAYK